MKQLFLRSWSLCRPRCWGCCLARLSFFVQAENYLQMAVRSNLFRHLLNPGEPFLYAFRVFRRIHACSREMIGNRHTDPETVPQGA